MKSIVLDEVVVRRLEVPLKQSYHLSYFVLENASPVVIEISANEGSVKGYGEADPLKPFTSVDSKDVLEELVKIGKELLGSIISSVSSIRKIVDGLLLKEYHHMTVGAVDMALLDCFSKANKTPLFELLKLMRRRKQLKVLYPLSNQDSNSDMKVIREKMKEGYFSYMLKAGKGEIPKHVERIRRLDEEFGKTIELCIDPNQAWQKLETQKFVDETSKFQSLKFIEQPIHNDNIEDLKTLNFQNLQLSLDESIQTLKDYENLKKKSISPEIVAIKVSKNGGILRSLEMIDTLTKDGKLCLFNSMIETGITQAASLHLACTTEKLVDFGHAFMSVQRLKVDFTNFAKVAFQDGNFGVVHCFDRSYGLGIEIDFEILEKLTKEKKVVSKK